jgi:hypothetical protein
MVLTPCEQTVNLNNSGIKKIDNKPVWPCKNNSKLDRLQNLFITAPDSTETSQQLFDVYTLTHVSHGTLFFLFLLGINMVYPFGYTNVGFFYLFVILETLWEFMENTTEVIMKYRDSNINSREYAGDSIINSIGDILSASLGYSLAWYNPLLGASYTVITECILFVLIKDNLLLNIKQIFM